MIEHANRARAALTANLERALRTVAGLAVLGLALPLPAAEGPLSGDQIRSLIVGNTVIGPVRGQLYDLSFMAGGEAIGATAGNTDSGTWRIRDGNVYCHHWTTFFGGDERCYQWYERGQGRYTLKNVDAFKVLDQEVWRIRPGLD